MQEIPLQWLIYLEALGTQDQQAECEAMLCLEPDLNVVAEKILGEIKVSKNIDGITGVLKSFQHAYLGSE